MNRIKRLFIALVTIVLVGLLYLLFQTDIIIISNQVATSVGVTSTEPTSVFTYQEGVVQYIEESAEEELFLPTLSSMNASLVIPRINIEGKIVEGTDEKMLDNGFWHYPSASPFASKGNVVIIGHRFLKLPPYRDTFYHLDWIKVGDTIEIKTKNGTVNYTVREKKVVSVTDTYVLQQTLNPQLTLVTCHPLWTSKERLVIIGDKNVNTYETSEVN